MTRRFRSEGPVHPELHYYVPRTELIDRACSQLLGDVPNEDGHYITVWAPRQTGKSWMMNHVLYQLQSEPQFDVVKLNLQNLKGKSTAVALDGIAAELSEELGKPLPMPSDLQDFSQLFSADILDKPLILILDEFDALDAETIDAAANAFRNIYMSRRQQLDKTTEEKKYRLHGLALIGVRAVLGLENESGSPFNIQRSVHIPNLTYDEVRSMFKWYSKDSGQAIEQDVLEQIFYELRGQPGLTSWMGEQLTETYNEDSTVSIDMHYFEKVYAAAVKVLPNNNILNVISKAKTPEYRDTVLELFRTQIPMPFSYDDRNLNFLYTNGVIDQEQVSDTDYRVKFASPFVQKRLFNYFSRELFGNLGVLHDPFDDLEDAITEDSLNVKNIMRRYEAYLRLYRDNLFKDAPRRVTDLRVYEAVYHFNLYRYLFDFLYSYDARIWPEFPTGNGKVDLIIDHAGQIFAIEVKSFANQQQYKNGLEQAAEYAQKLNLSEIALVFFVERVDEENRRKFEVPHTDKATGVVVEPIFVATG